MRGKGVFRENSHLRSSSRKKIMNNGKIKGTPGNVVLIDLDDDNVVIIDDTAESSQPKYRTSNVPREHGSSSVEGVINIDDDEDSSVEPIPRPDGDGDLVSDASSSKSQFPAYKTARNSANLGTGKCEVREKTSAFQFSKCKQTYRTTATGRNRYGLDPASDDGSTDIDCSDCEIMEDSFGKFREQWERASLRRKHGGQNRHSGFEDQGSASESNYEARTSAGEEKGKEQHPEVPISSSSGNADYGKENPPEFVASDGAHMETFSKPQSESLFVDADQKVEQEKPASVQESESFERYSDFQPGGVSVAGHPRCSYDRHTCEDAYDGIPGYWNNEPSPQESFKPEGGPTAKDHYCCNECKSYQDVCDGIPMFCKEKEPSPRSSFMSFEQEVGDKQQTHQRPSSREKENLDSGRSSLPKSSLFDEMEIGDETQDILIFHTVVEANSEGTSGKASYPNKVRADSDDASLCTRAQDRQDTNQNESSSAGEKGLEDNSELLRAKDGLVIPSSKSCIINERENLKGTEEYKRAIEEEWASRQRELRIQSEEAQRLRKRRKAESMRLCDIERRQKQRVEEVRQTQKKDAENTNLKEHFRAEVMKEIKRLEMTCIDMASLLRGLGIQVGGGFHPMSHDINAAYKRALLKFHPDRASRTDIRQLVEAEEKFKLISRMKEKLLLA